MRARDFFFFFSRMPRLSGAHPVVTRGSPCEFSGCGSKLSTSVRLMPGLRINETVCVHRHMPWWSVQGQLYLHQYTHFLCIPFDLFRYSFIYSTTGILPYNLSFSITFRKLIFFIVQCCIGNWDYKALNQMHKMMNQKLCLSCCVYCSNIFWNDWGKSL